MASCDLCGTKCNAHELQQLRDPYRVPGVKDICPDCTRWVNTAKNNLMDQVAPKLRDLIATRAGTTRSHPWWQRLFMPAEPIRSGPPPAPPRPPA